MKNVQESKWWKHFTEFAGKSKLSDRDVIDLIERLFFNWKEEDGKLYPFVFSQKIAVDVENDIIASKESKTSALSETDYIKLTLSKASDWAKQNNILNNKFGKFLLDPNCMFRASRGEYYKPLFLFCTDFFNRYSSRCTEDDLLKKKSIRAFHPEIYDMIKKSLMDKFID